MLMANSSDSDSEFGFHLSRDEMKYQNMFNSTDPIIFTPLYEHIILAENNEGFDVYANDEGHGSMIFGEGRDECMIDICIERMRSHMPHIQHLHGAANIINILGLLKMYNGNQFNLNWRNVPELTLQTEESNDSDSDATTVHLSQLHSSTKRKLDMNNTSPHKKRK
jgi:hypothetical protein